MEIEIGKRGSWSFTLEVGNKGFNNNMLVVGSAGSGKSSFVGTMLYRLEQAGYDGNIVVIDPTGEYGWLQEIGFKSWIPGLDIFINPLDLGGDYPLDILVALPEYQYGEKGRVSPIQEAKLRMALEGAETLKDVVENLLKLKDSARGEGEIAAIDAVFNRLSRVVRIKAFMETNFEPGAFNGLVHLDLSPIPGDDAKNLFTLTVLEMFYILARHGRYNAIIIVDESDRIGHQPAERKHVLVKIMDEMRKYGLFLVAVAHRLSKIAEDIIANCGYHFVFRQVHPKDLNLAYGLLGVDPMYVRELRSFSCWFLAEGMRRAEKIRAEPDPYVAKKIWSFKPKPPMEELTLKIKWTRKTEEEKLREEVERACRKALTELDSLGVSSRERRFLFYAFSNPELTLKIVKVGKGEKIRYSDELKTYVKHEKGEYKLTVIGKLVMEILDKYR